MGIDDPMIEPVAEVDERLRFTGDFARKVNLIDMTEIWKYYSFDYPEYKVSVNGEEKPDWAKTDSKVPKDKKSYREMAQNKKFPYGYYFGDNNAFVEIDMEHPVRDENLLMIGYSFDNPLVMLLASHFDKTYSIDFRYSYQDIKKEFSIGGFVRKHEIDRVVIVSDFVLWDNGADALSIRN
jgi:hypothetical protein